MTPTLKLRKAINQFCCKKDDNKEKWALPAARPCNDNQSEAAVINLFISHTRKLHTQQRAAKWQDVPREMFFKTNCYESQPFQGQLKSNLWNMIYD